jgi:ferredoxin
MPTIVVRGQTLTCEYGVNLRQVLLDHQINLYNGKSKIINCRGLGSCGTCPVAIEGEIFPPNWRDQTRRSFPPHSLDRNLRLACEGLRLESNSSP